MLLNCQLLSKKCFQKKNIILSKVLFKFNQEFVIFNILYVDLIGT